MGSVRRILLLAIVPMLALTAAEREVDQHYRRGLQAYDNERWALAVQEFEGIIAVGYDSEVLYYNLGNTYYRLDDIAGAVWAYEKALKMDPNDGDARYNLSLANLRVPDRIEPPEVPFFIRFYRSIRESFTPVEWIQLVSWSLLGLALLFVIRQGLPRLRLAWLIAAGSLFMVLLALVTIDSMITTSQTRMGIVYGDAVGVYSAPSERSTRLFELHRGLKVDIKEQAGEWYQIELLDGKSGWLPEPQLRAL
ncbi:MAG: tetratricopeptide repeat protein [Candidatus Neomarinimicrobiota bacterium]